MGGNKAAKALRRAACNMQPNDWTAIYALVGMAAPNKFTFIGPAGRMTHTCKS
jgi:hypothetical protein